MDIWAADHMLLMNNEWPVSAPSKANSRELNNTPIKPELTVSVVLPKVK